jgi:hypothetical protein
VFENRVLRTIFGARRDEITGDWRKLYSSSDITRQMKSRRMRWAGHVAHMGEEREVCRGLWWEGLKERHHLGTEV